MAPKLPAQYSPPAGPVVADVKQLLSSYTDIARLPGGRAFLEELYGREFVTRLVTLEAEIRAFLERELPESVPWKRDFCTRVLAHVIATDSIWFATLMAVRPGKNAQALGRASKALRVAQQALDQLPPAARFGTHLRLLERDLPPQQVEKALGAEMVYRTTGRIDVGLNSRMVALAEIAEAVAAARESFQEKARGNPGKPRVDRLTRHTAHVYEELSGQPAPRSGTGAGRFHRLLKEILRLAGLDDASAADAGRRRR
jgi:hypothetical protein